jgi:hypothetical protein
MIVWRPKTKGWVFTSAMTPVEAARMCAMTQVLAVAAQMVWKFVVCKAGWVIL